LIGKVWWSRFEGGSTDTIWRKIMSVAGVFGIEGEVSDRLLERAHLVAQILQFARGGLARRVARKAALASLQELLRPAVVEPFGNPLPPAELGDRRLAA